MCPALCSVLGSSRLQKGKLRQQAKKRGQERGQALESKKPKLKSLSYHLVLFDLELVCLTLDTCPSLCKTEMLVSTTRGGFEIKQAGW